LTAATLSLVGPTLTGPRQTLLYGATPHPLRIQEAISELAEETNRGYSASSKQKAELEVLARLLEGQHPSSAPTPTIAPKLSGARQAMLYGAKPHPLRVKQAMDELLAQTNGVRTASSKQMAEFEVLVGLLGGQSPYPKPASVGPTLTGPRQTLLYGATPHPLRVQEAIAGLAEETNRGYSASSKQKAEFEVLARLLEGQHPSSSPIAPGSVLDGTWDEIVGVVTSTRRVVQAAGSTNEQAVGSTDEQAVGSTNEA